MSVPIVVPRSTCLVKLSFLKLPHAHLFRYKKNGVYCIFPGKDFAKMSEDPDPLNGLRGLGKFKGYFNHLFKNFKNK